MSQRRFLVLSMLKGKTFHIGCQSWQYKDWITKADGEPVFYPRGTKDSEMLGLYSQVFDTIEVDSTLYGIPPESTIRKWYSETPPDFIFSLKTPRVITHDNRLRGPSIRVMNEFVERASLLGEKLGVFLVQFPASFTAVDGNCQALAEFLFNLPAVQKYAFEFRDESWFTDRTFDELNRSQVGLALVEGKGIDRAVAFKTSGLVAAPFHYVRLMGKQDLSKFDRIYRNEDSLLDLWEPQIEVLSSDEIYIYISNYFEGFAPGTINKLQSRFGLPVSDPAKLEAQGSLF